jgi:hypothetical protein
VICKGYIDESYGANQNVFSISCLVAKGTDWLEMERKWNLRLQTKNKELARAARPLISRYHASDCSGRRREFDGWSRDERDCFVLKLFELFKEFPSHTVVFDTQLDDLCDIFPEWRTDRLEAAYFLLTGFMMHQVALDFVKRAKDVPAKITLFHDRTGGDGKYDPTILRSFNQQVNDPAFEHRRYFTTITPLQWKHSVALQPADLVAFECFKEAEARSAARTSRRSYTSLIKMGSFGIHSMTLGRKAIVALRARMEEQQRLGLAGNE